MTTHKEQKRKELYTELKSYYGAINEITKRTCTEERPKGYDRSYVSRVLNQQEGYDNEEIWLIAAQVLIDLKEQKRKTQEAFNSLYQKAAAITLF